MTFPSPLLARAETLIGVCTDAGLTLSLAESCTGGMIAAIVTAVPGASDVLDRGFVTYSNDAKTEMLGVDAALIARHGAVSEDVARAMAQGALGHSHAGLAGAVTGIAGPGGGSPDKPVGLVHMAAARRDGTVVHERHVFEGNRDTVRQQAAAAVLDMLLALAAVES